MAEFNNLNGKNFFSSWSGGKDSCLSLHRAIEAGGRPKRLLTMFTEQGERSRSHGLPREVLRAQAESLSIPLVAESATWDDYEYKFINMLRILKADGIDCGVFGDIDLVPHREWVERVCDEAGITPFLPLWQGHRLALINEFIDQGFSATIVTVQDDILDQSFLGRTIDHETLADLEKAGSDACGENGEYHSVVTAGPIFSREIFLKHGDIVGFDGYSFLDVGL